MRRLYWKTVYAKAECVGKPTVEGRPTFKVVLTPKTPPAADPQESPPLTLYIDEQTSLITKIEAKVVTAAGIIPVEAYLSKYKQVEGLLISHQVTTKVLTQTRIVTIASVTHNVQLPKDRFDLPAEIKALANQE